MMLFNVDSEELDETTKTWLNTNFRALIISL